MAHVKVFSGTTSRVDTCSSTTGYDNDEHVSAKNSVFNDCISSHLTNRRSYTSRFPEASPHLFLTTLSAAVPLIWQRSNITLTFRRLRLSPLCLFFVVQIIFLVAALVILFPFVVGLGVNHIASRSRDLLGSGSLRSLRGSLWRRTRVAAKPLSGSGVDTTTSSSAASGQSEAAALGVALEHI